MQFFCTAGRGTEEFLADELSGTDGISEISKIDGKVFFTARNVNSTLHTLKCAERLFVQIIHVPDAQFTNSRDVQKFGKLIAGLQSWNDVIEAYRSLKTPQEDVVNKTLDHEEPPLKKQRPLDVNVEGDNTITFRVSCKLSPSVARRLDAQAVSRAIGWHLRRSLKWNVDTKKPFVEVCIHIGGLGVTAGIPTSSKPLSQRSYIQDFGLRSTVAWIIGRLANIQPGYTVLDPMCGAGTILVEAKHSWPEAHYIGIDTCPKQLERAKNNVNFRDDGAASKIELLVGNATRLPIKSRSVDALVCDLPFGNKYLTVEAVRELLPKALEEFNRVLKPGGHAVLLTSSLLKGDLLREVSALPTPEATPITTDQTKHCEEVLSCDASTDELGDTLPKLPHPNSPVIPEDPDSGVELQITNKTGDSKLPELSQKAVSGKDNDTATQAWIVKRVHYLKLGETPSHVCVFTKTDLDQ